jgi:hypothetical protein
MQDVIDAAQKLTQAGALGVLVAVVWAVMKGHLVLGRELTNCRDMAARLLIERDSWRDMALSVTLFAKTTVDHIEKANGKAEV